MLFRIGQRVAAVALVAAPLMAAAPAAPPMILILGVPHFGNPHRDMLTSNVADVLAPDRQREISRLLAALARTHPNHVAVEWPAKDQAGLNARYGAYRAGHYTLTADEIDQLGLRLAGMLRLPRVDAADWNEDIPGDDDFYDYGKWMKAHGRAAEFAAFTAEGQRKVTEQDALNRCRPVADWLRDLNSPAYAAWDSAFNFRVATFGDVAANPGAAWEGAWHGRNLRIAANLARVAGAPGDRTVAIFGAGHGDLLRRYAAGMGFTVADTDAALPPPGVPHCPPAG